MINRKERVLLLGNGGREHALAWGIARSERLEKLFICPTTDQSFTRLLGAEPIDGDPTQSEFVLSVCREHEISLVVVGPEGPLAAGISDALRADGIDVFGPSAAAAMLESSKAFTKKLCRDAGIRTARFAVCEDINAVQQFASTMGGRVAVKADGLAAGKGVVITSSVSEAVSAATEMFDGCFGSAGKSIVVEEYIDGFEVSCFALTDGESLKILPLAQDYKRAHDGDLGLNTGGMGAVSPINLLNEAQLESVRSEIFEPTLAELSNRGIKYQGVLYAGLMCNDEGIWLLEYNVRFGDPECQVLVPRMTGDWLQVLAACARGDLANISLTWDQRTAITVVMASPGYPTQRAKPTIIKDIDQAATQHDALIFHAGTKRVSDHDTWLATGGRVLNVTAMADSVEEARRTAYATAKAINWPEGWYRHDIGLPRNTTSQ